MDPTVDDIDSFHAANNPLGGSVPGKRSDSSSDDGSGIDETMGYTVGERVHGRYPTGRYYSATVVQVHEGGAAYTLDWDDGDTKHRRVSAQDVNPHPNPDSRPPARRVRRSRSVVTRASRNNRVRRAFSNAQELLVKITALGLLCGIISGIISGIMAGWVAGLTMFVLGSGAAGSVAAGLIAVAVLVSDTYTLGAKIIAGILGVLCGTPCIVAPLVLIVLVATGAQDGSTDLDSVGACPQMLGELPKLLASAGVKLPYALSEATRTACRSAQALRR